MWESAGHCTKSKISTWQNLKWSKTKKTIVNSGINYQSERELSETPLGWITPKYSERGAGLAGVLTKPELTNKGIKLANPGLVGARVKWVWSDYVGEGEKGLLGKANHAVRAVLCSSEQPCSWSAWLRLGQSGNLPFWLHPMSDQLLSPRGPGCCPSRERGDTVKGMVEGLDLL